MSHLAPKRESKALALLLLCLVVARQSLILQNHPNIFHQANAKLKSPKNAVGWKPLFGLCCPLVYTLVSSDAPVGRLPFQPDCGGDSRRKSLLGFVKLRL